MPESSHPTKYPEEIVWGDTKVLNIPVVLAVAPDVLLRQIAVKFHCGKTPPKDAPLYDLILRKRK